MTKEQANFLFEVFKDFDESVGEDHSYIGMKSNGKETYAIIIDHKIFPFSYIFHFLMTYHEDEIADMIDKYGLDELILNQDIITKNLFVYY